jgi:ATP-binding cassette subfamily C (CFTR/MRP) protein 1
MRTDIELNDALNLIQRNASASHSLREKFKLEAPVLAGGSNFSAGEAQLCEWMKLPRSM